MGGRFVTEPSHRALKSTRFNATAFTSRSTLHRLTTTYVRSHIVDFCYTVSLSSTVGEVTFSPSSSPTLPHFLHLANVRQHRGLFLTHPPLHTLTESDTSFNFSGTLFHAAYASSTWNLDQRPVRDVSTSHSLVLLYRLGTLDPSLAPIADQFSRIRAILASVPLGKEARERELGPKKGNAVLGGYDCVIWTTDAVAALLREGVVDFGGRSVGMAPRLLFSHVPIHPHAFLHSYFCTNAEKHLLQTKS